MLFSKKKRKIPKTTQDTLCFDEAYENGVLRYEDKFSLTMELVDISFKTKSDEEQNDIFQAYKRFLNEFPENAHLSLSFVNYRESNSGVIEKLLPPLQGDKFDTYRQEQRVIIKENMSRGRNDIKTKKYLTITVESTSVDKAMKEIMDLADTTAGSITKISGKNPKILDLSKRLYLLNIIHNQNKPNFYFTNTLSNHTLDINKVNRSGHSIKDAIAPEGLKFNGANFEINEHYGQSVYLAGLGNWMNTNFVAGLAELNLEGCFTIHINQIPQEDALKKIKAADINTNAEISERLKTSDTGFVPKELQDKLKQVEDLQDDLVNRDQRMFSFSLIMTYFGDTKEKLKDNQKMVNTYGKQWNCSFNTLVMQQERGFISSLPYGINRTLIDRFLTTDSLAIFIPFDEVNILHPNGFYYGINSVNKSLIVYDRKEGQNYNGLILGSAGSGKSVTAKLELINSFLNTNDDIFVIDPDGEYGKVAQALGGEVIKLQSGSNININPFDLDVDTSFDKEVNPLVAKTDFVCGIIETMIGADAKLTPSQLSIIQRSVGEIYRPYFQHLKDVGKTIDIDYCPTMQNLFNTLLDQPQPEAQNLALIMEAYTTGMFNIFARRTNVNINNRFVVYDISEIGSNLMELGLKVCTQDIWNRTLANRRRNKWTRLYIDEFHLMLSNDSTSKYFKDYWKRIRKFHGVPTGITQNVEDLLKSADARAIINNTSFTIMLRQSLMDREALQSLYHLSDNDMIYVTNSEQGSGLIYANGTPVPFTNKVPEETELYKLVNTKDNHLSLQSA